MATLDDPKELGRRIAAARGYTLLSKAGFAEKLGVHVNTLTRMERGEEGALGRTPEARRATARQVLEASGAPPEILDPDEMLTVTAMERLEALERRLGLRKPEQSEIKDELRAAEKAAGEGEDEDASEGIGF